jgi:hypothetical protein
MMTSSPARNILIMHCACGATCRIDANTNAGILLKCEVHTWRVAENDAKAGGHCRGVCPACQDGSPTYKYESDGDPLRRTHYIIAYAIAWDDPMRLDFNDEKTARETCRRLITSNINMEGAARIAGRKWL